MSSLFDTGIRPIIDAHLLKLAEEKRDYGEYWSASSAGYCMRKNIFERLGVPPTPEAQEGAARKQRVFTSGHVFHSWIQGLTKDAGISIAQELELEDTSLMIRGHIDDLILIPAHDPAPYGEPDFMPAGQSVPPIEPAHLILYDYKTQNSRAFSYQKDRAESNEVQSHYHKMQLGTYMYMLRNDPVGAMVNTDHQISEHADLFAELTEARILKISKDDLRLSEEQLMWSDELEEEVVAYWTELNKWWSDKKLPPCTCADHENGFLANEKYNPYYYDGEPCSLAYYKEWKAKQDVSSL